MAPFFSSYPQRGSHTKYFLKETHWAKPKECLLSIFKKCEKCLRIEFISKFFLLQRLLKGNLA